MNYLLGGASSALPSPMRPPEPEMDAAELSVLARKLEQEELEARRRQELESASVAAALSAEFENESKQMRTARLRSDHDEVRTMLRLEQERGRALTLVESNFLLAPDDHVDGKEYQCTVCYCDYILNDIVILDCRHFLCSSCMQTYFETEINNGKSKQLCCPEPSCKRKVNFDEVKRSVNVATRERFQNFLLEDHLRLDPNCRWCPRPGCGVPMIGSSDTPMTRCPAPKCQFTFCFNCKEGWHADVTCAQYQSWKAENSQAQDRFE